MIPALLLPEAPILASGEGPDLTRYLLVCAFLIVLVAALGIGFRRLAHGALKGRARKRALSTLDVLPLGGKQRVAVVRCYDRSYLIGLGDKEVRLLAALDEEGASTADVPDDAETELELPRAPRTGSFLQALRRVAGVQSPSGEVVPPAAAAPTAPPIPPAADETPLPRSTVVRRRTRSERDEPAAPRPDRAAPAAPEPDRAAPSKEAPLRLKRPGASAGAGAATAAPKLPGGGLFG